MAAPSSVMTDPSAFTETQESRSNARVLNNAVLPALHLAKAVASGIGIPGIEPMISAIVELATMLSTMQTNEDDLYKLEMCLTKLVTIDPSGGSEDLRLRLTVLTSNLGALATECQSVAAKCRSKQLFNSKRYKEAIQDIRNSIASHIQDFTFHNQISIAKAVEDMASKVNHVLKKETLATLACVSAGYNAGNTPGKCMDGTRVEIINDIVLRLTSHPDPSRRIVMLSGSAGSGKSTIAKSVASVLAEHKHVLAASFFFSRDYAERKEIRFLPSTIARQLAYHDAGFEALLVDVLDRDRTGILSADPQLQFQKLVIELLAKLPLSETPWVICMDALDECGKDRGQIFLRWLSDSVACIPAHVRFFLTGRPDVPSYLKFDLLNSLMHQIVLDDTDSTLVKRDIRMYVERSLDGSTWTTRDPWKARTQDVDEITIRAGGLFVFAATAVRYVLAGLPQDRPQRSIDYLLRGAPLTHLHDLYHRIVDDAIAVPRTGDIRALDSRDRSLRVLGAILHLFEPLGASSLAALLDMDEEDLRRALLPLSAVINIPESVLGGIRIIHLSFREFMTCHIQETRPDLLCSTHEQRCAVASVMFRVLRTQLKFNICDLPTSYVCNAEMPNLQWRLDTYIPDHLTYASRFWADHLAATTYNSSMASVVEKFLFEQFLFWLEVLSLRGMMGYAPSALSKLIAWIDEDSLTARIKTFALDAKRFTTFFISVITQSAPHIYLSALAMAPAQSEISRMFHPRFPRLLSIERGQMKRWPALIALLEGHTAEVNSVAFSPESKYIVSGSMDKTIRIWDAENGQTLVGPLEGHTDTVWSVAFSPDGKRIVSGSWDNTIRVWDAKTGQVLGEPFEGHTQSVLSVTFSPDCKRIASGSEDNTVRVWNVEGAHIVREPFEGHTDCVSSVAFSPDGKHIVSGSYDTNVRIWDAESGEKFGDPFTGHTRNIWSVGFSPDGKRIVSASGDSTLRVWDAETGRTIVGPFEGHTHTIWSVAFSPDGKHIVSGADDGTVRIWDAESGEALGAPLEGHITRVRSVAFSPDGQRIVSCASDKSIRLWESQGEPFGESFESHADAVRCVAFSPDGRSIVSASDDNTVRLWDAETGKPHGRPFAGHTQLVYSVGFSPDGKHLVSGSGDNTVRIWDVETGKMLGHPLEGHTAQITSTVSGDPISFEGVQSVAFSPNGKNIASGAEDTTVKLWDVQTRKLTASFEGHTGSVMCVAFSPDSKHIISGSHDTTVRIWDAESREALGGPLESHNHFILSVAFSSDGRRIVSGSCDETLRIWDAESRKMVGEPLVGHTCFVESVGFSPDGKYIVSGSYDTTVRLWDADSGAALAEFRGHTQCVWSVAFSPDSRYIVSGSSDKTVRVWAVELPQFESNDIGTVGSKSHRDCALIHSLCSNPSSVLLHSKMHGSGWVSCKPAELLFWVPATHKDGFWLPHNTLVIGKKQTLFSYHDFVHGVEWTKCYLP